MSQEKHVQRTVFAIKKALFAASFFFSAVVTFFVEDSNIVRGRRRAARCGINLRWKLIRPNKSRGYR